MSKQESALVPLAQQFPALAGSGAAMAVIEENLGGARLREWDLERVKVPSGGGAFWEVADAETGEITAQQAIEGIIVFTKIGRSYWMHGLDEGGGAPPDCSSPDSIRGYGNPGGVCEQCPLSQFGSAVDKNGQPARGQACKQLRFVFLLRPNAVLPTVLVLPPTSLKAMNQWLLRASMKGKYYWEFLVKFELTKVQNSGGISYAQVKPTTVRTLKAEERDAVQQYARGTKQTFSAYHEGFEAAPEGQGAEVEA